MRSRIAAVPALALSLVIAASGAALGQSEQPGTLDELDSSALESLCAANAPDEAALQTCIEVVQTILAPDGDLPPDGDVAAVDEPSLRDRVDSVVDQAVEAANGLDVQAAIDDAVAAVEELDIEAAIDEALAAAEVEVEAILEDARASVEELDLEALIAEAAAAVEDVDVEALIADAIDSAGEVDVQAFVDDIVGQINEQDVLIAVEAGVETVRNTVGAARDWIEENPELACDTGSVSVGVGAAAVVGFLTDSPGLALIAYRETQEATDGACSRVIN